MGNFQSFANWISKSKINEVVKNQEHKDEYPFSSLQYFYTLRGFTANKVFGVCSSFI